MVASEILYYLDDDALTATLERLRDVLVAGGRLVAVHWRPPGPERPQTAAAVHARLRVAAVAARRSPIAAPTTTCSTSWSADERSRSDC